MNFFVSCIYGDVDKYRRIKEEIKAGDKLWILGDILDGNEEDPGANIEIMNDIMDSPNVTLILGDHEYARCMEYSAADNQEIAQSWRDYSDALDVSGKAFNEFVNRTFAQDERDVYFGSFLVGSCELSAVIPIGQNYIYAVHGKPSTYASSILPEWQLMTCSENPDFKKDVFKSIKTDEFAVPYVRQQLMRKENTIAIVGQISPQKAADLMGVDYHGSGIFYGNKTIAIGRTYIDEPIPLLGVDAAGFFVKGIF